MAKICGLRHSSAALMPKKIKMNAGNFHYFTNFKEFLLKQLIFKLEMNWNSNFKLELEW